LTPDQPKLIFSLKEFPKKKCCLPDIASTHVHWSSGGRRPERIRISKKRNRFSIWQPWEDAMETAATLPSKQQQQKQQQHQTGNEIKSYFSTLKSEAEMSNQIVNEIAVVNFTNILWQNILVKVIKYALPPPPFYDSQLV